MTNAVAIAQQGSNNTTFRNRIINGAMVIDQRNNGASGTASAYTVDRWGYYGTQASKGTWQQNAGSVTPPAGFTNYLGFTSSSAYSVISSDLFEIYQWVEGYNIADLAWGTANAKTVTLSFWVRSSLTGTFGGSFINYNQSRTYPFSYTISSANTWTQISITVAGDTTGTWNTTNTAGIGIVFGLGVGSTYSGTAGSWSGSSYFSATGATSVVGTSGATFYITGVQLEAGSAASPFENRLYGTELSLCQRYYEVHGGVAYSFPGMDVYGVTGQAMAIGVPFAVTKRTAPTVSATGSWNYNNASGITAYAPSVAGYDLYASVGSTGRSSFFPSATGFVTATAEL
jgi:hypothetical protein